MLNADHERPRPRGLDIGRFDITWKQLNGHIRTPCANSRSFLFSDWGAIVNIDSEVAVRVLLHFADMGVAVLPVHDF